MRPAAEIIAELRKRGLADFVEELARKHHATLEQVCSPSKEGDVTPAKHAIWSRLADHFEDQSAVARIWGVHHSSVLNAVQQASPEIVHVELASFKSLRGSYAFGYERRNGNNDFYVQDRVTGRTTWFGGGTDPLVSFNLAREVYAHCCEEAGEPSFRAVSVAQLTTSGGAS